jgi:hypothetical protein
VHNFDALGKWETSGDRFTKRHELLYGFAPFFDTRQLQVAAERIGQLHLPRGEALRLKNSLELLLECTLLEPEMLLHSSD